MSSDDELPPPRISPDTTPRARRANNPRKRSHEYASDYSTSSDAPFFSSDDLADASIDQYASPAKKKQYRRAWYEPEDSRRVHSYPQMRAATKKPKDSGVFLNSDSSTSSADDGFAVEALNAKAVHSASKRMAAFVNSSQPKKVEKRRDVVEEIVARCLERGDETVDLSHSNLDVVSGEALQSLSQLIRKPVFGQEVFTEQACHSLTPELKIFLASNRLRSVPGELFDLKTVAFLSLRANRLEEIPMAISKLHNLKELSVASNRLRYLPWELLHLIAKHGKLDKLWLEPNPFLQPLEMIGKSDLSHLLSRMPLSADLVSDGQLLSILSLTLRDYCSADTDTDEDARRLHKSVQRLLDAKSGHDAAQDAIRDTNAHAASPLRMPPTFVGATPATFFNPDGSRHRASPPSISLNARPTGFEPCVANPLAAQPPTSSSHVRTLFELALQSCSDSPSAPDLDQLLPSDSPSTVAHGIATAQQAHAEGGRQCSACSRAYVVPRAEWIEYWYLWGPEKDSGAQLLGYPFLRRVCGWNCARDALSGRCEDESV